MKTADYYNSPLSPWDCAMKFYAVFQIIGSELPAVASLTISIERILAVQLPYWYRAVFKSHHRIGLLLLCILFCVISLITYFLTVLSWQTKAVPWGNCALTYSSDPIYNRVHQILVLITQITASGVSIFAFYRARKSSRGVGAMRKEVQSTKPILAVSLLSVALVTLPQLYLLSLRFFGLQVFGYFLYVILMLPCINSFMNFFIYIWLKAEFRKRLISLLLCRKIVNPSAVVPTIDLTLPKITQVASKI